MNQQMLPINSQNRQEKANFSPMQPVFDCSCRTHPTLIEEINPFHYTHPDRDFDDLNETAKFSNLKDNKVFIQENGGEESNEKTQFVFRNFKQVHKVEEMNMTAQFTRIGATRELDEIADKPVLTSISKPLQVQINDDLSNNVFKNNQITRVIQNVVQPITELEFFEIIQDYSRSRILELKKGLSEGDRRLNNTRRESSSEISR